jgi:hypothetical protein
MKILFKLTSRSRPKKLIRTIENIKSYVESEDYIIWCTLDEDDESLSPIKEILAGYDKVMVHYGKSNNKVHAINRDMDIVPDWDLLFNVSDDQIFIMKGFDNLVRKHVEIAGGDCFLHYPDDNAKHHLATMSVMDRKYYDRDGYIYHPDYISLWCDNEAMEVAKRRKRYYFYTNSIFDHLHPAYKKAPFDAQYEKTESYFQEDRKTYLKREAQNFGLND